MNAIVKQTITGVSVVVLAGLLMGSYRFYNDVSTNTQHRVKSVNITEDIHDIKKDICWIKGHLRGEKLPDCNQR